MMTECNCNIRGARLERVHVLTLFFFSARYIRPIRHQSGKFCFNSFEIFEIGLQLIWDCNLSLIRHSGTNNVTFVERCITFY